MKRFNFVSTLAAAAVIAVSGYADVPKLINYQGRLTTPAGAPVPNATYSVTFTIWETPAGGSPLWSEMHSVVTNGGLFSVQLGTFVILPDTIFDGTSRWVGVTVSPDPEMPRQRLVSTPYSYRVRTVDGATGGIISGNTSIQSDLTVSGNVGIGTTSPLSDLHIESSNPISTNMRIRNTSTGDPDISFLSDGVFQFTMGVDNDESDKFQISSGSTLNSSERLTVTSTGNVGIGTTSPIVKLHVNGVPDEGIRIQGLTAGASNYANLGFYDGAGTRIGYVGDGSAENNSVFLAADIYINFYLDV